MHYVYVISSIHRNYIYVGISQNVENRVAVHNLGRNKTTKPYSPFRLIFVEVYNNRTEARKREKYLKSGIGKDFIKGKMKE